MIEIEAKHAAILDEHRATREAQSRAFFDWDVDEDDIWGGGIR